MPIKYSWILFLRTKNDLKPIYCFTGADLAGLCREAAICALRDDVDGSQVIDRRHFETALLGLKPSVSQQDLRAYELWGIHTR